MLERALAHPRRVFLLFGLALAGALVLVPLVGRDFFPAVDAGQIRLHVNAPPGTRLEETERLFTRVENAIRELIPERDRTSILDQIGMLGGYNLAVTDSATVSSSDGEILIGLAHHRSRSTQDYERLLRSGAGPALPRGQLLLPAGRHRDPDPELRAALAHRRAGVGPPARQDLRRGPQAGGGHAGGARGGRRPRCSRWWTPPGCTSPSIASGRARWG